MSDIDYSQFSYKRASVVSPKEPPPIVKPEEPSAPVLELTKKTGTPKKQRKGGKIVAVFTIIIILFTLVFFVADLVSNGKVIDSVTATFKGNYYEFYYVVCEKTSRNTAYALSLQVKQGGGSGYIFSSDSKFLVVYSVYTEQSAANSVSSKNQGTYVKSVTFRNKNSDVYNACYGAVKAVGALCNEYDTGSVAESRVKAVLSEQKAALINAKAGYKGSDEEIKELLDLGIDSFNNIDVTEGKLTVLSELRYANSMLAYSMQT